MEFNPKVSIVIPVYNGSNYLRDAIDSALAQTYGNIEVIVINDGSNDEGKTENIALSYGNKIRYLYKENGGISTAFNLAIREMTGEYFSWLSHDDVYYPNKIEEQINYLKTNKKEVILYSDYDLINPKSEFIRTARINHIKPQEFRYALLTSYPIHGCTALIPKNCFDSIGLFNEQLKTTQDLEMWFRMAKKYEFIHIAAPLIKVRLHHNQGIISMKSILDMEVNYLLLRFLDEIYGEMESKLNKRSQALFFIRLAIKLKKVEFKDVAKHALELSLKDLSNKEKYLELDYLTLRIYYKMYSMKLFFMHLITFCVKISKGKDIYDKRY